MAHMIRLYSINTLLNISQITEFLKNEDKEWLKLFTFVAQNIHL